MNVGYIGLGAMGKSLARHLVGAHELWVYDINEAAIDAMVEQGARKPASVRALAASCDMVLLCLPRSSDVHALLFGSQDLAASLRPGTVVIDQSSGAPNQSAQIAQKLAALQVTMIDAPVSGGIPAARSGNVTIFASGPDAAWSRAEPVLRKISNKIFRCSDRVGVAQALKLINNAMGAGYRLGTLEAVAMARKAGLSAARMAETLGSGPAANYTTRHMLPARLEGRATTDFSLALMIKDLNEALALGLQRGVAMPITATVRSVMQVGLNTIGMQARLENLIDLVEKMSGSILTDAPVAAPPGYDPDRVAAALVNAVATCNRLTVLECAATGLKCGLGVQAMGSALNAGSAWSNACEVILADPGLPPTSQPAGKLGELLADLEIVARLSAATHSPLFVANSAVAVCQAAVAEFGEQADSLSSLRQIVERNSAVKFSHG